MVKDKEDKAKKHKGGLHLNDDKLIKVNLSFAELSKKSVTIEIKKKKEDKDTSTKK